MSDHSRLDAAGDAETADAVKAQKAADDAVLAAQKAADQKKYDDYVSTHHTSDGPTPPPPPPPPSPSTPLVGASLGLPLPDASEVIPAVRYYRTPSWSGSVLEAQYKRGTRCFVMSTKDATPDGLVAFCKAVPADVTIYATVNHEPDDDIRAGTLKQSTYAQKMNAFGQAVAGFKNVRFGPIHNGSYGKAAWVADEQGCDRSLWDFWGMDRYSAKYETPATQFAEGHDYAKSLGLPLVIGECGADPGDAAKQKTLAGQIRAWTLDTSNQAAVVCWWQQTGYTFADASVQRAFLG